MRRRDLFAGAAALVLPGVSAGPTRAAAPDIAADDWAAALRTFQVTARAILAEAAPARAARPANAALRAACHRGLHVPADDRAAAFAFFTDAFALEPLPDTAFCTGYYEPELAGALTRSETFRAPLLARPDDLEPVPAGAGAPLGAGISAGRRDGTGRLVPYPTRAAIDAGALGARARPLCWVADSIEAFMVHVQGSARVRLADGGVLRLAYAGRNGRPYTSIGRILVTEEGLAPEAVDLAGLKSWVRAHGQGPDEAGGRLMARNESYIFFAVDKTLPPGAGPRGGAGVPLTAGRSLAVDRDRWSYGLPFWLEVTGPDGAPIRRLMIAQDTGSAIVGPARFDMFFGSGAAAGAAAGAMRASGRAAVLRPRDAS